MCAIRESKDPIRTLDAFWRGQIQSKEWLIDRLVYVIYPERNKIMDFPVNVDVFGGWVGVLPSMLFQSAIPIQNIRSIDIDQTCMSTASMMNKKEEMAGRFRAITADMCDVTSTADIVINTSCEHLTQEQYDQWIKDLPKDALVVLQGNDYDIDEHVRISKDLEEFKQQCGLSNVQLAEELQLPKYKRFMVIGYV
jgi:hypothetical protein